MASKKEKQDVAGILREMFSHGIYDGEYIVGKLADCGWGVIRMDGGTGWGLLSPESERLVSVPTVNTEGHIEAWRFAAQMALHILDVRIEPKTPIGETYRQACEAFGVRVEKTKSMRGAQ